MNTRILKSIATLSGAVIGAGIFGIPYVFSQAGFFTGLINLIFLGLVFLMVNLYVGEISLRTKGKHQLVGYAEKYLGKKGKTLMLITGMIAVYGALVAYATAEGDILSSLFGVNSLIASLIFIALMIYIVYHGINSVTKWELFLNAGIFIIAIVMFILCFFQIEPSNLTGFSVSKIFVPYGVIMFAFLGMEAIPDLRETLNRHKKELKKSIIYGSLVPLVIYLIFTIGVVGVTGANTSEVATLELGAQLGNMALYLGNIFAIFAMATSFLVMALALFWVYNIDYKIKPFKTALLVFVPTIILTIIKPGSFIQLLAISGAIAGGIQGIMIILMHRKSKLIGQRKPEYEIKSHFILDLIISIVFISGVFFTIYLLI
jgi:tyrosine-specific transport protein